ncbi:uncharacterized protein TM35_000113260 [Trypanosoma theileri]|uniref:UPF3 domain-containing protein n=1 Tax=Trypanosoma theileri TaxID=67003 RepID=A0A1X0NYN1_9TRYP|nr:uncharacterized protein TM35_000113260 [Trypanosoma theileri]ORC89792.1 hypothetical protein TM35_000113260 [Trypanosoma theileri]
MAPQIGIRQPIRLLIRHLPYDITIEALLDVIHKSCEKSVIESIKEAYVLSGYPQQNNRPRVLSTAVLAVQMDGEIEECEGVIQAVTDIFDGRTVFPERESSVSAVELSPVYLASFSKTRGNGEPNREISAEFQQGSIEEDEDYRRFCAMLNAEPEEIKSNVTHKESQDLEEEEEVDEHKQKYADKCSEKPESISLLVQDLLGKIKRMERQKKERKKRSVKEIGLKLLYQSRRERARVREVRKDNSKPRGAEKKRETKGISKNRSKERKVFDSVQYAQELSADVKSEKMHQISMQNLRKKRKEEKKKKRSCDRVEKLADDCKGDIMDKRRDHRKKRGDKKKEDIINVTRKERRRREKDVCTKNENKPEERRRKRWEREEKYQSKPSNTNEVKDQQLHKKNQRHRKNRQEDRSVRHLFSRRGDNVDKNEEPIKSFPDEKVIGNIILEKKYVDPCREDDSLHASRLPKTVNAGINREDSSSPRIDKVRERQRRRERRDKKNSDRKAKNQPLILRILTKPDENTSTLSNN